ncbi:MAG: hypothetical protein AB7E75_04895 [Candidatus Methanomethylophilaceae archaeon]|nr:hypothetical protein [Candidatus Methanomethylophilaceae archaeon]NCA74421.1 hypothetical protein [Gammaproteobacteria bacterium]MDD3351949.1 hypothetical protein [Candidatus Methanomethylophilaceae archaeon]MDD3987201.1 hypothetical protein [Candidatus Methanomethylophilaceae archaeon]MDD4709281.1 hypothetical protein [Candidatus Methanomethylophilaceae archaeon]
MKTLAVGCGGAGSNIVRGIAADGIDVAFINTDSESDIPMVPENIKGCRGDSSVGRALAEDYAGKIDDMVSGYGNVIIAAGLGGGTGTGMAPLLAERSRAAHARTVSVICAPMEFEGRGKKAYGSLAELMGHADRVVRIDLDLVAARDPSSSFEEVIAAADMIARETICRIAEIMEGPFFSIFTEKAYTVTQLRGGAPDENVPEALRNPLSGTDPAYGKAVIHADSVTYRAREAVSDEVCSMTGIMPEIVESGRQGTMVFIPVPFRP